MTNTENLLRMAAVALRAGVHPEAVADRIESALAGGPDGTHYSYGAEGLSADIEDLERNSDARRQPINPPV